MMANSRYWKFASRPVANTRFEGTWPTLAIRWLAIACMAAGEDDGVDLQLQAFLLAFRCPVAGKKVEYRLTCSPGAHQLGFVKNA